MVAMQQDLLAIQPLELKFPFELKKQVSCQLGLQNKTNYYVAFKVKTTSPKKYCVRPNTGIIEPQGVAHIIVTMQAQREAPADMICKDKFLVQSVVMPDGNPGKEVSPDVFSKESNQDVREAKLKVLYVNPPAPPSPVAEGSEEGLSPKAHFSDVSDRTLNTDGIPRDVKDLQHKLIEARSETASMTERYNGTLVQMQKYQTELATLQKTMDAKIAAAVGATRGLGKNQKAAPSGFSLYQVLFIAIIFFLLGYFLH